MSMIFSLSLLLTKAHEKSKILPLLVLVPCLQMRYPLSLIINYLNSLYMLCMCVCFFLISSCLLLLWKKCQCEGSFEVWIFLWCLRLTLEWNIGGENGKRSWEIFKGRQREKGCHWHKELGRSVVYQLEKQLKELGDKVPMPIDWPFSYMTLMLIVDVDLYIICDWDIAIDYDEIPVRFIQCHSIWLSIWPRIIYAFFDIDVWN